jgi:hypothetical protein
MCPLGSSTFTFFFPQSQKKKTLQPWPINVFLFQFAKVAIKKKFKNMFFFFPQVFLKQQFTNFHPKQKIK